MKRFHLLVLLLFLLPESFADQSLLHDNGNVIMSVSDFGGFMNLSQGGLNSTFIYPAGDPSARAYLQPVSELWMGNSKDFIASSVDVDPDIGLVFGEWQTTENGVISYSETEGDRQVITAQYRAKNNDGIDILVDQTSYSWADAGDFIVVRLTITNLNPVGADGVYLAIISNWNVDNSSTNGQEINLNMDNVTWDDDLQLSRFTDGDASDGITPIAVGTCLIEGKLNGHVIAPNSPGLYYDDTRAALMFDSGKMISNIPMDFASVISVGPYDLETRSAKTVIFAFVAGKTEEQLEENVHLAQRMVAIPGDLTAEVIDDHIELSWESPVNPRYSAYTVYRKRDGESNFALISAGSIQSARFKDYDVEEGVTYEYLVRSVDDRGEAPFDSLPVRVKMAPKPDSVTGLTAERIADAVILMWDRPVSEDIANIIVFRNHTGEPPWTPIATLPPEAVSYEDREVVREKSYYYAVAVVSNDNIQSDLTQAVSVLALPNEDEPLTYLGQPIVAPIPCSLSRDGAIEFLRLPAQASINIYSMSGDIVHQMFHSDGTNKHVWDLTTGSGNRLSCGIYFYMVKTHERNGEVRLATGKFAVLP